MLTLTEAAEKTGKSKSTLIRSIKAGKLSANRNEHGDYRVDPSELFRVFQLKTNHDEPNDAPSDSPMVADLLEMVKAKDSEISEMRDELTDTQERLAEQREASRALMSPEDFESRLATVVKEERAKHLAKSELWEKSIAERKQEIDVARREANEIREREEKARAEHQAEMKALKNRGLIDRLLNRGLKTAEIN